MSNIRLESSEDVKLFLKLLAEESIKDAKLSIKSDPEQASTEAGIKSDEKFFTNIHEQDEEDSDVEVEEETEEEVPDEDASQSLEVSLDSISDAVKNLRSGRSVDDSSMKSQLRDYFDRLDALEREALLNIYESICRNSNWRN